MKISDGFAAIADRALAGIRSGSDDDAIGAATWLLRRYRRSDSTSAFAADTEVLTSRFGEQVAAIEPSSADVADLMRRIEDELATLPPRNAALVWLVSAPEDACAIPVVVALLSQFEEPLEQREVDLVSALLTAMRPHATDRVARTAIDKWAGTFGEPGDRAREAIASAEFAPRRWRTVDDLIRHVIDVVPMGWDNAPPVSVLAWLLQREAARQQQDDERVAQLTDVLASYGSQVPHLSVTRDDPAVIARQIWSATTHNHVTTAPLAVIMAATASEEVVPYLLELLDLNTGRSGTYASVTHDTLVEGLRKFSHRPDVQAALTSLETHHP